MPRKRSLLSLGAAVLLTCVIACQAMAPVGSGAKGGLSGSTTVAGKPADSDLPGSSSEDTSGLNPIGPVVDKGAPEYRPAIDPIVAGKSYAWGPEAPMPPKSDPDIMEWCLVDGKWVLCHPTAQETTGEAPVYDPSKEREPEAFRILLGSHPFNTQEAEPWPKSVDVFEDQNGFQLYQSYVVQVGATLPKLDGTSAFAWWDILRGPYLRMVFTPKGQPTANATYVDMPIGYRNTSAGNWNAAACWFSCDVRNIATVSFYLYYETDPLAAPADFFKKPPLANLSGIGESGVTFPPGAFDAFIADTKHVHALGSFTVRDGNAPMKRTSPGPGNHWLDPITIPRSAP